MIKAVAIFRNSYQGKDVDENFDTDMRCFGPNSNLSVRNLMRYAFPKNKDDMIIIEYTTRLLSQFEMIDSFIYFKKQIFEVYKEFKLSWGEEKRIGVSGWIFLEVTQYSSYIRRTHEVPPSYVTIHAIFPSVHSISKNLTELNLEGLSFSYPAISSGFTDAYDEEKRLWSNGSSLYQKQFWKTA